MTTIVPFNVGNGEIIAAMGRWNDLLNEMPQMPKLQIIQSGGIPLTIHASSPGDDYCGRTSAGSSGKVAAVNVWASSDQNCVGSKSGSLAAVLTHELAHVLGWNASHGGLPGSRTSVTENCTTFLPSPSSEDAISAQVCLHDVEALFRAHFNSNGWTHSASYFSSPMLWTTNAPGTLSMAASASSPVSISQWLAKPTGTVTRSKSSVDWDPASSLFTVNDTGLVTAGSTLGSAMLYLKATTSPPSGYEVWTPFKENGDSVAVTVSSNPLVTLYVTNIKWSGDSLPIYDPGSILFTAHVGAGDTTGVTYKWIIKYSNTPNDSIVSHSDTLPWGPRTKYITIPSPIGSYTLSVKVRPGRITGADTTYGNGSIREFSVCPRPPGEEQLMAEVPIGGGTDAVGGC